ncbi:hypothetical protein ADL26_15125, partial [Thermoactinomyces vulgaris]
DALLLAAGEGVDRAVGVVGEADLGEAAGHCVAVGALRGHAEEPVGEAALRHTLDHRAAADAALVVRGEPEPEAREAADAAVAEGARRAFAGLPVTVRTLPRSATYALPGARGGEEPPLTHLAALDRSQLR